MLAVRCQSRGRSPCQLIRFADHEAFKFMESGIRSEGSGCMAAASPVRSRGEWGSGCCRHARGVFRRGDQNVHFGIGCDDGASECAQLVVEPPTNPVGSEPRFCVHLQSSALDMHFRVPEPHRDGTFTQLLDESSSQFRRVRAGVGHVCAVLLEVCSRHHAVHGEPDGIGSLHVRRSMRQYVASMVGDRHRLHRHLQPALTEA